MSRGAQSAARRSSSSWVTNDPVGLFGLTRTSARVLDVTALSTLAMSIAHAAWKSRSYGRAHTRSRRGEQVEQQRVRFAGARGQHDAIRRHRDALTLVVARDGLTRVHVTERLRR